MAAQQWRLGPQEMSILRLVTMATYLERTPNECKIYQALLYQPWKFGEGLFSSSRELASPRSTTKNLNKNNKTNEKHQRNI